MGSVLQTKYCDESKNLNIEVRVRFVNVECFFDFKGERGVGCVDDFEAGGWIVGFTWMRFKKVPFIHQNQGTYDRRQKLAYLPTPS